MYLKSQEFYFNRARASLREAISRYAYRLRLPPDQGGNPDLQAAIQPYVDRLEQLEQKLNQRLVRIAAFGLVSRGKSAVLNALLQENLLETGPLNGVTRLPQAVRWSAAGGKIQVELIDTPGLDEIQGQARAKLAQEIAYQADLILFVVAGDITRTEFQALWELQQAQKPLLLVFNKIDLYPDRDRQAIYEKLQALAKSASLADFSPDFTAKTSANPTQMITPEDVVRVAAAPVARSIRVEWPDGSVTYEQHQPPPQIAELQQRLLTLLNQEGRALLALNAMRQAQEAEVAIVEQIKIHYRDQANLLIGKFARYKAVAIALNPIAVLDFLGGTIVDLVMIRALAKLYGLPMTRHQAGNLWRNICLSIGGLLLSEVGSGLLLGFGKSTTALSSLTEDIGGVTTYASTAIAQAGLASYGTYRVGQATLEYLEQGCTWGIQGASTVIQEILHQAEPGTILHRLHPSQTPSTQILHQSKSG